MCFISNRSSPSPGTGVINIYVLDDQKALDLKLTMTTKLMLQHNKTISAQIFLLYFAEYNAFYFNRQGDLHYDVVFT